MSRGRRGIALAAMTGSLLLIAAVYGTAIVTGAAPRWAAPVFVAALATLLVATMVLGAGRANRPLGRLAWPFAFVWLVLAVGFGAVLLLHPASPTDPTLWLGLPPRAAVILYGIGILPALVLPLAYALTFDE